MDINDQVNSILSNFRSWFEEAIKLIQETRPGERLPVMVMSERVATKFNLKSAQVYPVLRFLNDTLTMPGFKRQKGAQGGWLRDASQEKETK